MKVNGMKNRVREEERGQSESKKRVERKDGGEQLTPLSSFLSLYLMVRVHVHLKDILK